jgi:hypothetical protein
MKVEHAFKHLPTDPAKAIDANFRRHEGLLNVWGAMSSPAGSQSEPVRSTSADAD